MTWRAPSGLYAIVDPEHCAGRDPRAVAEAILHGGCAALQLRSKAGGDGERLSLARALRALCHARGVPFVMNDRPDLARLADADGLHLGQDDLALVDARRIVGSMPIGRSTHSLEQALRAVEEGACLLGFGPVFPTQSKVLASPVVGLSRLSEVARAVPLPIVAIGGIDAARATDVRHAGAHHGAAIRALCAAPFPEEAARVMHAALREA